MAILITSRTRNWDRNMTSIDLKVLKKNEAVAMVKKGLNLKMDDYSKDEEILKLVEALQCFPLALNQAISYMVQEENYEISQYLTNFLEQKQKLLDFDWKAYLTDDYTLTTYSCWKMTVEKITKNEDCGHLALPLLNYMAYLPPDKIERKFFKNLEIVENDETILKEAFWLLVKYSMVNEVDSQKVISIHRLQRSTPCRSPCVNVLGRITPCTFLAHPIVAGSQLFPLTIQKCM